MHQAKHLLRDTIIVIIGNLRFRQARINHNIMRLGERCPPPYQTRNKNGNQAGT